MSSFVVAKKTFDLSNNVENATRLLVSRQSRDLEELSADQLFVPLKLIFNMPLTYAVNPTNNQPLSSFQTKFPSGKYDALAAQPTWIGHRFVGWFPTNEIPSTNVPLTTGMMTNDSTTSCSVLSVFAHWQLPSIITFDATTNGGQMPSGWTSPYYYIGQAYGTLPTPTHPTLNFKGWYTLPADGQKITSTSIVSSAATIYAQYTTATYQLVDLGNDWELNTSLNPDQALYDGCYQSFSNYGVDYSTATLTIKVIGYSRFTLYIRCYAAYYDYVKCESSTGSIEGAGEVSPDEQYYLEMKDYYESLGYYVYTDDWGDGYVYWSVYDQDWNQIDSGSYQPNVPGSTSGTQSSDTSINGYKQVVFDFDNPAENYIYVRFEKNSGWNDYDDRGYLLIPYDQN